MVDKSNSKSSDKIANQKLAIAYPGYINTTFKSLVNIFVVYNDLTILIRQYNEIIRWYHYTRRLFTYK